LRQVPTDYLTWAQLGAAYVQRARETGDPSYYPKSQGALQRSLQLDRTGNWQALAGMGALANARHDFAGALRWARSAAAINSFSATVYGIMADAQTQLGDAAGATASIQRMLDLQPGVSSFARASYDFELHGQVPQARHALQQALAQASDRADIAFCRYYLGELAFDNGDLAEARTQYAAGLTADPTYTPLLAGRAKAEAAAGEHAAAVRDYATVVQRIPQPQYVLEYGELLQSLGRTAAAGEQYALLASEQRLFAANGVVDDLTSAQFAADHGSASDALRHATAEAGRRHMVLVADALGWALHRSGDDVRALQQARTATALGWRNATFYYHRGMIENSLGQRAAARSDLSAALRINPYFSLLQAPVARRTLAALGGPQ
ncbi:MAG: hypothetical protein LC713_05460, partial [Actinobacteria bacterium]|nr:hypothetical protein [Actinomycetota bacterium]